MDRPASPIRTEYTRVKVTPTLLMGIIRMQNFLNTVYSEYISYAMISLNSINKFHTDKM